MITLPMAVIVAKGITAAIVIFGVYQVSDMVTDLIELVKRK